eukprot:731399-Amphidinium_carterae.1
MNDTSRQLRQRDGTNQTYQDPYAQNLWSVWCSTSVWLFFTLGHQWLRQLNTFNQIKRAVLVKSAFLHNEKRSDGTFTVDAIPTASHMTKVKVISVCSP